MYVTNLLVLFIIKPTKKSLFYTPNQASTHLISDNSDSIHVERNKLKVNKLKVRHKFKIPILGNPGISLILGIIN